MPIDPNKSKFKNDPKKFPIIPEGLYTVEVVDAILREGVDTGKYGIKDKIDFYLGILDKEQRGQRVLYSVSRAYNAGFKNGSASALYEFACAVYGEQLDDKKDMDANTLIGGRAKVILKHTVTKDGRTFANVKGVLKADEASKALTELTNEESKKVAPKAESSTEVSLSDEEMEEIDKSINESIDDPNLDLDSDFDKLG